MASKTIKWCDVCGEDQNLMIVSWRVPQNGNPPDGGGSTYEGGYDLCWQCREELALLIRKFMKCKSEQLDARRGAGGAR